MIKELIGDIQGQGTRELCRAVLFWLWGWRLVLDALEVFAKKVLDMGYLAWRGAPACL